MKKFIGKNKKIIIMVLAILLAMVITVTFAYFALESSGVLKTEVSASSGDVDTLIFADGDPISLTMTQFNFGIDDTDLAGSTIGTVTYTNNSTDGEATDTYDLYFEIAENTFEYSDQENFTPELILTVNFINDDGSKTEITEISGLDYVTSDSGVTGFDVTTASGDIMIVDDYVIKATEETIQKWEVTLTIINLDILQTNNLNKVFDCNLAMIKDYEVLPAVETPGTVAYTIVNNNGGVDSIEELDVSAFYGISTEDNTGMYKAEDDYGTSYYFRGDIDNNWVYFAGFYWQIVRIDGDGNVKLVYAGTDPDTIGTDDGIYSSTYAFNSSYSAPKYVGYTYSSSDTYTVSEGDSNDSTAKGMIDGWYETYLLDNYSSYLADVIWCNDRTTYTQSGSSPSYTYTTSSYSADGSAENHFGAYTRLGYYVNSVDPGPSYKCPSSNDAYTVDVTTTSSLTTNGLLDYPIALLTADEIAYAGGSMYSSSTYKNTSFFLYTGSYYWTLSPYYSNSSGTAYVFYFNSTGYLYSYNSVSYTNGLRVSVSLSSEVSLTGGTGSKTDPYKVE